MEIIYVLTNEAMPGYVKIGKTNTSLDQRIKELSASSSIPVPFNCYYACTVKNANLAEKLVHDGLKEVRANPKREFFLINPERVVSILKLAAIEDITPTHDFIENSEDKDALEQARKNRPAFNFKDVNIAAGSTITFVRNSNITATVESEREIKFKDKITSLSKAAQEILGYSYPVAGTLYWKYGEQTLDDLRRKLQKENNA